MAGANIRGSLVGEFRVLGFCGLEFTVQGFWGLGPGFIYIYTHVFTYLSMPWKGGGVWGLRFGVEGDHPVSWQVGFGAGGKQNPFIILKALQYCPGSERPKASCFTRPETLSHIAYATSLNCMLGIYQFSGLGFKVSVTFNTLVVTA